MERLVKDTRVAVEAEKKQNQRQNELFSHSVRQEIARLKKQNAYLSELLESERKDSMKARDVLIKRVSSMLVDFADERDKSLRSAVSHIQDDNAAASIELQSASDKQDLIMSESAASSRMLSATVEKTAIESDRAKLLAEKV